MCRRKLFILMRDTIFADVSLSILRAFCRLTATTLIGLFSNFEPAKARTRKPLQSLLKNYVGAVNRHKSYESTSETDTDGSCLP
jgi:hypothetical protein